MAKCVSLRLTRFWPALPFNAKAKSSGFCTLYHRAQDFCGAFDKDAHNRPFPDQAGSKKNASGDACFQII